MNNLGDSLGGSVGGASVPTFDTVSFSATLVQTEIVHYIFLWGRDPSYSHPHLHIGNHLCYTFQLDAFQSFKFPSSVSSYLIWEKKNPENIDQSISTCIYTTNKYIFWSIIFVGNFKCG